MHSKDDERVILYFGQQWTHYTDNSGYYGSLEFFRELSEPLVAISEFLGLHVAENKGGHRSHQFNASARRCIAGHRS